MYGWILHGVEFEELYLQYVDFFVKLLLGAAV